MKLYLLLPIVLLALSWRSAAGSLTLSRTQDKEAIKQELFGNLAFVISNNLFTQNKQLYQEIVGEVFEEELTNENAKMVIRFVGNQPEEALYFGYKKIYQIIKEKCLNDAVLFELAYQLQDDLYKGNVLSLLNLIPPSVGAMISAPTVCIKNRGYGEFFYAAGNDNKFDTSRRNVFTWNQLRGKEGDWHFRHLDGNKFHIVNAKHNEYLYAEGDALKFDNDRRRIFTGTNAAPGAEWALELEGNDVLIKNVHFNEYIYTAWPAEKGDTVSRRVYAWVPKGRSACDTDTYQCRWLLHMC